MTVADRRVLSARGREVMLFHEPFFALFLFPGFYAAYLLIESRIRAKKWALILASLAFYTWGEPLFVPVVLVSALIDYGLSQRIAAAKCEPARRAFLIAGIALNIGILIFYKYAAFIAMNLNLALKPFSGAELPILHIALPIGVSFIVFEKISYLVDCYRGLCKPARTLADYSLFVFLFPKLLAGPILKYHEMERQIADPLPVQGADFEEGFLRTARGMAKKILIADPLGVYADRVFGTDAAALSSGSASLGLVCFTLQIYFDFSAYSDMAIGIARMLGFRLKENFNMPYIARSLTEFWRRWHMSLTSWIREYLYVPLGGNRGGEIRTYLNLWICFLLSGVWHGANWNFVLWGAYNGLFLTLERMFLGRALDRAGALVSTAFTLMVVMLGWAIFRTTSMEHLTGFVAALIGRAPAAAPLVVPVDVPITATLAVILCLLPATPLWVRLMRSYETNPLVRRLAAIALVLLWAIACGRALAVPFKPFIYFRF
jgi:alginate O-acetyltransferase complex protein AlgI